MVNAAKADAKLQALQERMALEKQESVLKLLPTPCYVVDEARLIKNLELLHNAAALFFALCEQISRKKLFLDSLS